MKKHLKKLWWKVHDTIFRTVPYQEIEWCKESTDKVHISYGVYGINYEILRREGLYYLYIQYIINSGPVSIGCYDSMEEAKKVAENIHKTYNYIERENVYIHWLKNKSLAVAGRLK